MHHRYYFLRPFDELYVSFYTPRGVYVYKHNLEIGVKMVDLAKGKKPVQATMYESLISAEAGIQSWKKALDEHILPALDESGCSWVGFIDFEVEDTLIDPYADSRLRARALHAPSFQPNRCVAVSQPQCTLDADTDEWRAAFRPFGPQGASFPGALPDADLAFLREFERTLVAAGTIRPRPPLLSP